VPLAHAAVELTAELGELDAVVHALGLEPVADDVGPHRAAGIARDGDDVGQVLLTLGVVRADLGERVAQHLGVERVDPGVDLGEGQLVGGGVLVLDDALDPALRIAHHPAVPGGVVEVRRDDRHRAARLLVRHRELDEGVAGEQRNVAVRDEDRARQVCRQRLEAALDGAAGALDVVLVGDDEPGIQGGALLDDAVALVADHHADVLGPGLPGGPDRVADQRQATDAVQNLGCRGLHPGALTRGEDDDSSRAGGAHARELQMRSEVPRDDVMLPAPPPPHGTTPPPRLVVPP
jgi:hypothetical protein